MTDTIEVQGLVKRYAGKAVVDDVSFTVREGEFFGLLGPNGAGKTTTLEMIEGLRRPDAGSVVLLGEAPWPRNPRLLPRIGVQLQATAFFDRLTAREQLSTFGSLYDAPAGRVDEMLELVGLTDKAGTQAEKLSGGQSQRLSIACALVHDPDVVFLDEPTAALDPQARRNLWDLLREINGRGKTVVLTTHYMDEAEILCDRVAIIDEGRILRMGPPADLVRGLSAPTRISVERAALGLDDARSLPGAESAEQDATSTVITSRTPAPVLAALAERDALAGLQVRGATLEDVFLELTGRAYRA
ncbi:ABC transporter ATP-binding protein [Luteipulveratus sp. YIM 133132]|uniref:ABC transporter ATP-binding protein n=1 Tax=Luteipulveratus flavus TaxID=3031728 RepID=UPI0023AFD477|nr:ABC transporter ATP-binding protein [Luteipulveratus sp. YIM 133132]MDE9364895.1 ABC transporter ATP-binding protein [Luteipulveratus sp. YIM 133132]